MSNLALTAIAVGVVLSFVVLGTKGLQRLLLVVGLAAIGLLALLIWVGKLSFQDVNQSVQEAFATSQESFEETHDDAPPASFDSDW